MSNRAVTTMVFALTSALALASCGKKIGDSCQTPADCDPNGARICDLSQPGGYCTIQGCDETTCPSEAACIRYFPVQFLTKPCNPYCEDRQGLTVPDAGSDAGMSVDAGALPLCPGLFAPAPADQPGNRGRLSERPDERLHRRRDLPRRGPLCAALDRDALLRPRLFQQQRLPQRLRLPPDRRRGERPALGDPLRADLLLRPR